MKLHCFPPSPNSRKVLAVAAYLELPLEVEIVHLVKGEQRLPSFLALNPNGKCPAFSDGDYTLWESNAILHYLATRKANRLWPADGAAQADILRWLYWEQGEWLKGCGGLLWERMVKQFFGISEVDLAAEEAAEAQFRRCADLLEHVLSKQDHVAAYGLSLADFALAPPLDYAVQCRMPLADFPKLSAWYQGMAALPAWQASTPKL